MKLNQILTKTTAFGVLAIAASVSTVAVNAQTSLFSNTNSVVGNFNSSGNEIGDEIILADNGTGSTITNFNFGFYSSGVDSDAAITIYFYANNGPAFNGVGTPGTILWSNSFPLSDLGGYDYLSGAVVDDSVDLPDGGVAVPSDFTWAIEFSGLGSGEAGALLSTNPTPAIGYDYNDYWLNTGTSSSPNWTLATNADYSINFGAEFGGTANPPTPSPEPSSMALMGLGVAGLVGFLKRNNKRS